MPHADVGQRGVSFSSVSDRMTSDCSYTQGGSVMKNAKYVVFDGMDGSGKGTQIELLQKKFSDVVFTFEPGGTPFADEIRKIVRDNPLAGKSTPLNNFLLFWAAREELQHNLVVPTLQSGKHVFSDRGDSSTFAYQICGEQNERLASTFVMMRNLVFHQGGRRPPDFYIIFDLPAEVAHERVMAAGGNKRNHFDTRNLAYYERVRNGFWNFKSQVPSVVFVDAGGTPEEVHELVLGILIEKGVIAK